MKKRGDAAEFFPHPVPQQNAPAHKPVVKYLVILFVIAVALILASFAMNQHSNAKVLQELQGQVETLQQLQTTEEKYREAMTENESLKQQIDALTTKNEESAKVQQALELVWQLERLYTSEKHDECRSVLKELKKDDLYLLLPPDTSDEEKEDPALELPAAAFRRIDAALNPAEQPENPTDNTDAPAKDADNFDHILAI